MNDQVTIDEKPEVEAVATTPEVTISSEDISAIKAENERLKAFHERVTKEKQEAVAKAKAESDRLAREKAESEGDYKQLLALKEKEYKEALKEYETKISSYEGEKKSKLINDAASTIASDLAKGNTGRAKLLAEKLASRIKYTEDGLKVIDEKGSIVSERLDTLVDFAKKEYDFLCDGLQSTGGGATGGGRTVGKRFSDMTSDERAELYKKSPEKYAAAKAASGSN